MRGEDVQVGACQGGHLLEIQRILKDAPEAAMWSEEALTAVLNTAPEQFLVARTTSEIMGFVLGRTIGNEAEILNLAVRREFRRNGAGTALVSALLKQYDVRGIRRVFLEVRESNRGAIAFYEGLGFQRVGKRVGYYRDPVEGALVLSRDTSRNG